MSAACAREARRASRPGPEPGRSSSPRRASTRRASAVSASERPVPSCISRCMNASSSISGPSSRRTRRPTAASKLMPGFDREGEQVEHGRQARHDLVAAPAHPHVDDRREPDVRQGREHEARDRSDEHRDDVERGGDEHAAVRGEPAARPSGRRRPRGRGASTSRRRRACAAGPRPPRRARPARRIRSSAATPAGRSRSGRRHSRTPTSGRGRPRPGAGPASPPEGRRRRRRRAGSRVARSQVMRSSSA